MGPPAGRKPAGGPILRLPQKDGKFDPPHRASREEGPDRFGTPRRIPLGPWSGGQTYYHILRNSAYGAEVGLTGRISAGF